MKKFTLIISVGILTFLMGGCGALSFLPFIGSSEESVEEDEKTAQESAEDKTEGILPKNGEETPEDEVVAATPFDSPPATAPPSTPTGLIQSTDPEQRVKVIQTGRQDPFAFIPVDLPANTLQPPVLETPEVSSPPSLDSDDPRNQNGRRLGENPQSSSGNGRGTDKLSDPDRASQGDSEPGKRVQPFNNPSEEGFLDPDGDGSVPQIPNAITLPQLPVPSLAQNVEVTGVVQVGAIPQAIIKAPNEVSSRYVKVGQYLANGQVLVKRIDMNEGPEPIVVLEQFGIEVAKRVGEKPLTDDADDSKESAA